MTIKSFFKSLLMQGALWLSLLLTAGTSALLTMQSILTSQEVEVPRLVGQRLSDAGDLAARERLLVRLEGRRHDVRVPPGRIMAQEPTAGGRLKAHRSVRVWLSLGPKRIQVPAVQGESVRTARLKLEHAQIFVRHVAEVDDWAPQGTVLIQRPPAGTTEELPEGAALLVSRGPEHIDYLMPDLIGQPVEKVLLGLRRAGLKVSDLRYRPYPGVTAGIVLRQDPPAGHRVTPRNTVSLDVSQTS